MIFLPKKLILILVLTFNSMFFANIVLSQDLKSILSQEGKDNSEVWKKERLNYYLDNQSVVTNQPESFFYSGNEKLRLGLYKEAIEDYKKAIKNSEEIVEVITTLEKDYSNTDVFMNLSQCFTQLDNYDSAIYYCERAIEEDKYYEDAYMQKAYILLNNNKSKQALGFLDEAENIFPESKKLYYEKGNIYLALGKVSKAKKYIRKSIKIDPDFEEARLLLVNIHILTYNFEGAMRELRRSIKNAKNPQASLFFRAYIYLIQNNLSKAYNDLNKAYIIDTTNYTIGYGLSLLSFYYENYDFANKLYRESWNGLNRSDSVISPELEIEDFEYGYFINEVIKDGYEKEQKLFNEFMYNDVHGNQREIKSILNNFLKENPDSQFAKRLELVNEDFKPYKMLVILKNNESFNFEDDLPSVKYFSTNVSYVNLVDELLEEDSSQISFYWRKCENELIKSNYDTASYFATRALEIDSTFFISYKLRGFAELYKSEYEKSVADFNYIVDNSRSTENCVFRGLALAHYKSSDYRNSIKYNMEILDRDPDSWDYYNTGLAYEKLNVYDTALLCYDEAIKMKRKKQEFYKSEARVYMSMGDTLKAIGVLKQAYDQSSKFIFLVDIADLLLEIKDYEEALNYYEKINKIDKNYTYGVLGVANCKRILGDNKEAIKYYDIAIEQLPEHAFSYYGKALVYYNEGDYRAAMEWALEAEKLNSQYAEAFELIAKSAFKLSRYNVSYAYGVKTVKADPANLKYLLQLGEYTLIRGSYEDAAVLYSQILEKYKFEEYISDYLIAKERLRKMSDLNIKTENIKKIIVEFF